MDVITYRRAESMYHVVYFTLGTALVESSIYGWCGLLNVIVAKCIWMKVNEAMYA